jgi:hypothetical protein
MTTLTEVFPSFFLCCKANSRVKTRKDGARPALFLIFVLFYLFFVLFYVFCVVLCIVCFVSFSILFVYICVLNCCHRVAVKYVISYSSLISIQPLGRFSWNQNPVRRPVWLWHTSSWASSYG